MQNENSINQRLQIDIEDINFYHNGSQYQDFPKQNKEFQIDETLITEKDVDKKFLNFINNCHRCKTEEQKILINKAYILAKDAHKGATRNSGDAFINHPVEVAIIVAEDIGLGTKSVVCALLHDVVTNSNYSIEDIEHIFGNKISTIVDNLAKIKGTSQYFSKDQSEVYRKLLIGISEDIRIIFIKLADRLHNMRTLSSLEPKRQKQIAYETQYIYAPLAHRLGLFKIKSELEDLAFKYLHTDEFNVIANKIKESSRKEQIYMNRFSLPIIAELLKRGFKFDIKSRLKSITSIWNKIQNKKVTFEEIYDILAIRIIITPKNIENEVADCMEVYDIITQKYRPNIERTRNWLGNKKKDNGYEALHTTLLGDLNKWVEVQIRTTQMDEVAELGFAAHWKYKGIEDKKIEFDRKIIELKNNLEQVEDNDFDYLENFKILFTTEIIIYSHKGQEYTLPVGSTVLDFAFIQNVNIGKNAIAAKVNRKLVSLNYTLQSGDKVEIITSEKAEPKSEWINIVKTDVAKKHLKVLLKDRFIHEHEKGVEMLAEILKKHDFTPNSEIFKSLLSEFKLKTIKDLYIALGTQEIEYKLVDDYVKKKSNRKFIKYWKPQLTKRFGKKDIENPFVIDDTSDASTYIISSCCNPIPGDNVIGVKKENNNMILIHKKECKTLTSNLQLKDYKELPLSWKSYKAMSFLCKIDLEGHDELGIINKITTVVSNDLQVNIKSLHINANGISFTGWLEVYVFNNEHIEELRENIAKIKGVTNVVRIFD